MSMSGQKKIYYLGLVVGVVCGLFFTHHFIVPKLSLYTLDENRNNEAKNNLRSLYYFQIVYFEEYGRYGGGVTCFTDIAWGPAGMNWYSYYCGDQVIKNLKGDDCPPPTVPHGVTETSFTVVAVSNIDSDPECDVWTMNDAKVLKNIVRDR